MITTSFERHIGRRDASIGCLVAAAYGSAGWVFFFTLMQGPGRAAGRRQVSLNNAIVINE
ncbi:hypothetical protein BamIOP4010DRAFT_4895 [Burkholderia ambifaria IOP40-10]|uniref:Uncharacterized protein n=1 Tax=Burkholderia ambifaria IOP40-10 TaxID=396596 RepID=B1FLI4_9BURK|nr:hypothetical protein BamIOP4010DRAFT_4895 [Burkholderia ambifaria IOP40-10]